VRHLQVCLVKAEKNLHMVTFLSTQTETPVQSALIDTGAVHTIIGKSTLDNMMKSLNIGNIEKCQPLQVVHRFSTHGVP
jgi:predicted aspartyl protease